MRKFLAGAGHPRTNGKLEHPRTNGKLEHPRTNGKLEHPRTNGKLEGFRGEIRRKNKRFDGTDEFVQRHGRDRPRGSPDQSTPGTPARAFARMPEKGQTVKDEHAGDVYLAG